MTPKPGSGIVARKSAHSVDETVRRREEALRATKIKVFAQFDHSGDAEQAGLQMPNTKLVIFGHVKAGTPIMVASPSAAIDLPLKILIAEDTAGGVWLMYNSTSYFRLDMASLKRLGKVLLRWRPWPPSRANEATHFLFQ